MFRRINLVGNHCRRLVLVSHPEVSLDLASKIFSGSHSHQVRGSDRHVVVYGTLYRVDQQVHTLRAEFSDMPGTHKGEYHLEVKYETQDIGRPPPDIKPVSAIAKLLDEASQSVEWDCRATFVYDTSAGWSSEVPFPVEMPLPLEMPSPVKAFTHIESVTLSRREGGRVETSVELRMSGPQELTHVVRIRFRDELTKRLPEKAMKLSAHLSRLFVSS